MVTSLSRRYVLRPPLALERLKVLGPDLVAIALERPWADGSTHVTMSVSTFLTRLAALVPRPRVNTTLYFGVLASHAKHRADIVPEPKRTRSHGASWAALMRHAFDIERSAYPARPSVTPPREPSRPPRSMSPAH